jgi:hypothetical protein
MWQSQPDARSVYVGLSELSPAARSLPTDMKVESTASASGSGPGSPMSGSEFAAAPMLPEVSRSALRATGMTTLRHPVNSVETVQVNLLRVIGTGNFGVVLEGTMEPGQQRVAVKRLLNLTDTRKALAEALVAQYVLQRL